jgi:hypothetical protein
MDSDKSSLAAFARVRCALTTQPRRRWITILLAAAAVFEAPVRSAGTANLGAARRIKVGCLGGLPEEKMRHRLGKKVLSQTGR